MHTIISTNENTFSLVSEFDSSYCCQVKVQVEHYLNDTQQYFNISYSYTFPCGQPSSIDNPSHPFFQKPNIEDIDGVIVTYNEMTVSMVKYLMINDSELSKFTGTSTPMRYRRMIMIFLDSLWD